MIVLNCYLLIIILRHVLGERLVIDDVEDIDLDFRLHGRRAQKHRTHRDADDARIVGGQPASSTAYTYQVALLSKSGTFRCGGSLIADDIVVTAAHCKDYVEVALIGAYDLTQSDTAETIPICQKVNQSLYDSKEGSPGDICLLQLCRSSTKAKEGKVHSILVNADPSIPLANDLVTVTGWGTTREGGNPSQVLQEVSVKYYSQESCKAVYKSAITDSVMCAGVPEGGKDACQGDSGGPLVISTSTTSSSSSRNPSTTALLVGVVSWGIGCGEPNLPGVYTRISYFVDWILSTGCELSEVKPCNIKSNKASTIPHPESSATASTVIDTKDSCVDQPSFVGISQITRNCNWVNDPNPKKKQRRCQLYKNYCPQTCGESCSS